MVVTDPIADMLTRIRNANQMKYKEVLVPTSKLKVQIANILKNEGYINGYKLVDSENGSMMNIELKYGGYAGYFEDIFGLDKTKINRLRELYTE